MRAVFLDKDGTLIENEPFNVNPDRINLVRGAELALRRLHKLGYALFVVSNQPGVALGYFEEAALRRVERHLRERLADFCVPLAGFYYCPHHPSGQVAAYSGPCACRKPAPGLVRKAARAHGIYLSRSWLIGDILDDVEAGKRAGCGTILINNGNETEWVQGPLRTPDHVVSSLPEAVDRIESARGLERVALENRFRPWSRVQARPT
jgi:D-glycero-D-manno-heptose 1,7-bisphosphate phosphatase